MPGNEYLRLIQIERQKDANALANTDLVHLTRVAPLPRPNQRAYDVQVAQRRFEPEAVVSTWVRGVMPIKKLSKQPKVHPRRPPSKQTLNPITPYNIRIFLDSKGGCDEAGNRLPLPQKAEEIMSSDMIPMEQVGMVQSSREKAEKGFNNHLYAEYWRLEGLLREERQRNRLLVAKARHKFLTQVAKRMRNNPTFADAEPIERKNLNNIRTVQPSTSKKRKRAKATENTDIARKLFLDKEASFFKENISPSKLRRLSNKEPEWSVKLALEYLVCKFVLFCLILLSKQAPGFQGGIRSYQQV